MTTWFRWPFCVRRWPDGWGVRVLGVLVYWLRREPDAFADGYQFDGSHLTIALWGMRRRLFAIDIARYGLFLRGRDGGAIGSYRHWPFRPWLAIRKAS